MKNGYRFLLSVVLVLSLNTTLFANEEFTSSQIKTYKKGIFEVVTLKLKDNVVYKDEFPEHLLPFHIRKDKYISVGTAFLIDDNTFVSAAHVFSIGVHSLRADNMAVRDTKGNIFNIKRVEKYSNYRDLIQFTVDGDTSAYHKFTFAEDYEEGDVVYAAGNALGQGVIFRKGSLTSFTYETVDGQWKDIRYSAAASPGNSGGPLLNLQGEVIGIVTKKSNNENLNYALPIKEFQRFPSDKAEFFTKSMGEVESNQRLLFDWKFSTELPKTIAELRAESEQSFYNRFTLGRNEFVEKFEKELFPNHPNVIKYLKEQDNSYTFGVIEINGNGEWLLFSPDEEREIKITENQYLYYSSNDKMLGKFQFLLEKPENGSLADFLADRKGVLDTFLTSMKWNRKINNTEVYIESYGDPVYEETHTDKYGRTWLSTIWHDQYADRGIFTYCLPLPDGIACDLLESSIAAIKLHQSEYVNNLHRIMISYSAKLKGWKEFMELPGHLLPEHLKDSNFSSEYDEFNFKAGEFAGELSNLKLTEDSTLFVVNEIDPDDINKLIVASVTFKPNTFEDGMFYVAKLYDLGDQASEGSKDFWNKFSNSQPPYNNELIDEGKVKGRYINLDGVNAAFSGADKAGVGYLAGCQVQSEVEVAELNESCDSFLKGITLVK